MNRRKIPPDASGSVQGTWDPGEPTFPPGSHKGLRSIDGGPPIPVSYQAAYVERKRLRVLDCHWRGFLWLLIFWRGFRQSSRPALEILFWRAGRRSWLNFWQWETDPDETGMEVTMQAIPPDEEGENLPPPGEPYRTCVSCSLLRQAGIHGECPACGAVY